MSKLELETRKKFYNSPEFKNLLYKLFDTGTIDEAVEIYKGKSLRVKLGQEIQQGRFQTHLYKGFISATDPDSEEYEIWVKHADKDNANALEHVSNCARYIEEANLFEIDNIPLSVTYRLPTECVLSEHAGKSLSEILSSSPNDEYAILIAVANNIFGVSKNTLTSEFGENYKQYLSCISYKEQNELIRPNEKDTNRMNLFKDIFQQSAMRLINESLRKYETLRSRLCTLKKYIDFKLQSTDTKTNSFKEISENKLSDIKKLDSNLEAKLRDIGKLKEDLRKNPFESDMKVMFLPTDLYITPDEHIRVKKINGGQNKYSILHIDDFLYPENTSASTPMEAYFRLIAAAKELKRSPNDGKIRAGKVLEEVAKLIGIEYLDDAESPVRYWIKCKDKIDNIMNEWGIAIESKDIIGRYIDLHKKEIDTACAALSTNKLVKLEEFGPPNESNEEE